MYCNKILKYAFGFDCCHDDVIVSLYSVIDALGHRLNMYEWWLIDSSEDNLKAVHFHSENNFLTVPSAMVENMKASYDDMKLHLERFTYKWNI